MIVEVSKWERDWIVLGTIDVPNILESYTNPQYSEPGIYKVVSLKGEVSYYYGLEDAWIHMTLVKRAVFYDQSCYNEFTLVFNRSYYIPVNKATLLVKEFPYILKQETGNDYEYIRENINFLGIKYLLFKDARARW